MTRSHRARTILATIVAGALLVTGTTGAYAAPQNIGGTTSAHAPLAGGPPSIDVAPEDLEAVKVETKVVPIVAAIIAVIVKFGAKQAAAQFGKAAVKEAFKKSVLGLNASKWSHIMAPKHNWSKVGAQGNKDKIADLIGDAMANGTVSAYGTSGVASQAVWTTGGQTIVVTFNKSSGVISNAWVR